MSCAMCAAIEAAEQMAGQIRPLLIVEAIASAVLGECRALGVDAVVASLCPAHSKEHERAHSATMKARTAGMSASS